MGAAFGARDWSGAAHAIESRETAGQDTGQILPVRRRLPILAQRYERHVLPELRLQLGADALLLLEIAGVEPGGAQLLYARAAGPAVYRLLAVRANGQISVWMH